MSVLTLLRLRGGRDLTDGQQHRESLPLRQSTVRSGVAAGQRRASLRNRWWALTAHLVFGFGWHTSLLIGAALCPTDPAVVFSVLGQRQISGRSGTLLEGESGANDPVGIALMAVLLDTSGTGISAFASGLGEFALQMAVGAVVGIVAGFGLERIMRLALPNEALYSIRAVAAAAAIYALATLLYGSGFLAVLVAGILIGDARAPYKREVERFTSGLSGLAEIVAFTVLGLTISISEAIRPDVLWVGLALGAILILIIRPILVGLITAAVKLDLGERAFVLWARLKGAVPILLGTYILAAGGSDARRVYEIVIHRSVDVRRHPGRPGTHICPTVQGPFDDGRITSVGAGSEVLRPARRGLPLCRGARIGGRRNDRGRVGHRRRRVDQRHPTAGPAVARPRRDRVAKRRRSSGSERLHRRPRPAVPNSRRLEVMNLARS